MTIPSRLPPLALLAGGLATRLLPLTNTIPKSMLPVAGEPFIAHQLRLLRREDLAKVVICAGHLSGQIAEFVGDGRQFGLDVDYSIESDGLLGTGGALKKAAPLLGETFFVMYGDSYLDISLAPVYRRFVAAKTDGLMTVFRNDGRWDVSNIEFEDNVIRRYDKIKRTPAMTHIDYGLGILRAESLAPWPVGRRFDLADVYQALIARGKLAGFEVHQRFYEIGSNEGLSETDEYLSGGLPR